MTPEEYLVLVNGMAALRELFKSMIEAGFTEFQACVILGTMMSNSRPSS